MHNSRDFGVYFWIIATIDFFNFQRNSCIVRVPTKESVFCSSSSKQTLTSRLRSKRSDSR